MKAYQFNICKSLFLHTILLPTMENLATTVAAGAQYLCAYVADKHI